MGGDECDSTTRGGILRSTFFENLKIIFLISLYFSGPASPQGGPHGIPGDSKGSTRPMGLQGVPMHTGAHWASQDPHRALWDPGGPRAPGQQVSSPGPPGTPRCAVVRRKCAVVRRKFAVVRRRFAVVRRKYAVVRRKSTVVWRKPTVVRRALVMIFSIFKLWGRPGAP